MSDEIDAIDARILRALSADGRLSHAALGQRVGLSASAAQRRVQRLERSGAIAGYRAVVAPRARGGGFTAYVAVGLSDHSGASQGAFERAMGALQAVRECHNVTGTVEYLLRVEVPDLGAYKAFHATLGAQPHVVSITSYVVMDSPKDERA